MRQILPSLQPASLLTPLTLMPATSDDGGRDPEHGHMGSYSPFHGYSGISKTYFKIHVVQEGTVPEGSLYPISGQESSVLGSRWHTDLEAR